MARLRSAVRRAMLFALVSIVVASLLGFVFPLMSTVFDFGELAHHACSVNPHGRRRQGASGVEMKMIA